MKILVFPRDKNPYQEQLYSNMPNGVEVSYIETKTDNKILALINYIIQLIQNRLKGYTIFHLHWLYSFNLSSPNKRIDFILKTFVFAYIVFFLLLAKILGYKVVWTIHNIVPHEPGTINDSLLTRYICAVANVKIVHSQDTLDRLKTMNANTQNAHIVPHGSFVGLYPNTASKLESRKHLGIDQNKFTFLFFGMIREYKGIDTLLEVFPEILKAHPGTQLIIAGACNDDKLRQEIENAQEMYKNSIYTRLEQIPDEEIQYYFNAADIAVFPFKRITTSGSVLLALSFGVPVVYPLLGNLKEIPAGVGFGYGHNEPVLRRILVRAINCGNKITEMRKIAIKYTFTLSWRNVAIKTYTILCA